MTPDNKLSPPQVALRRSGKSGAWRLMIYHTLNSYMTREEIEEIIRVISEYGETPSQEEDNAN